MSNPKVNQPVRILVFGALGRMGTRIGELASHDRRFELLAGITRSAPSAPSTSAHPSSTQHRSAWAGHAPLKTPENIGDFRNHANVVIDFSSDVGTREALRAAVDLRVGLLVGTTALSDATIQLLRDAARSIPVLVAPNTSLGVAVVARIAKVAAHALGNAFDCSIVEAHHNQKKDAPSGTALRIARAVREAGAKLPDDQILAMRGGDVVGEHTLRFAGTGEYIEITHRATTRDLFARGALHAAHWLARQTAGWYTIEDTIEIPA